MYVEEAGVKETSTQTVSQTSVETSLCIQTTLTDNSPAPCRTLATVTYHNHVKYVLRLVGLDSHAAAFAETEAQT